MPLTREQFQRARDTGYTVEQIIEFEKRRMYEEGGKQEQVNKPPQQPSIQPQNILGQVFNVPGAAVRSAIQGKGYAQGAMNPDQVPQFSELLTKGFYQKAGVGPLQDVGAAGAFALGTALDMATNPADLLSMLLGTKAVTSPVGKAIGETAVTLKNDKLAGRVINSLIKPQHKEWLFGKNPGMGVAKEGITAANMESLQTKVAERIGTLDDAAKAIRNTPENINKSVDLSGIRKPLVDSLEKLKLTPRRNAAEITGLQESIDDITGLLQNPKLDKIGLSKLNISDAYEVKKAVARMQKWTRESTEGTEVNAALKQVYHLIDEKIDKAVPELENLNARMADLISADKAIGHRIELLQSKEPATWSGVLNLPFAAYRSTGAKTTLGKLLANTYKIKK